MNIYSWADVVSWVREVLRFDPDEVVTYLSACQRAHLNAQLADLADEGGSSGCQPMAGAHGVNDR